MKRFAQLPKEIKDGLDEKLIAGERVVDVARWLQSSGYCGDLIESSLTQHLYKYVNHSGLIRRQLRNYLGEIASIVKSFREIMSPEEGYQFLVHIQMERVVSAYEEEAKSGQGSVRVAKEIALLEKILKNMSDIDTDRTLRYLRRISDPDKEGEKTQSDVYNSLRDAHGESAARAALDPSSRRKVLSFLETLSSRIDGPLKRIIEQQKETIDMIPEEKKSD